ncbi:hypothetical protein F8161_14705 [Bacillus cereus]|uniref:hypothetical protein n=1 Tax=Bacillus TaxID=1386 RepID=UPI0002797475|nr:MULTISPECIES: hypothetical protein [Bacillus cereus group]EJR00077.1 hypothetical protein II5_05339 [Bacillus cereus MSX-A1]KAB2459306.1 hypothetical protein F8161_14705 [Bacillus cereus]MDR4290299.1 hypothetical protein [Bacillus cereus]OUA86862.1 hypothetical protein BK706_19105 [Bacillus thuringiensis serovar leesis]PEZ16126.1 hypothetical protein CN345_30955 [Bacillus thuringiensis]
MFGSVLSLGILASTFALTEPAKANTKANTRDDHVEFTFRLWSAYDFTNARPKENPTSMYMRVKSSEKGRGSFNVWTEADKNKGKGDRDWVNVSGKHEGEVKPYKTYLFMNHAVESYGKNVPVRFGGYSRENNAYPTAWSPDSVRPSGPYTEY